MKNGTVSCDVISKMAPEKMAARKMSGIFIEESPCYDKTMEIIQFIAKIASSVLQFIHFNRIYISISVILILVFYVIYKCFYNHILYVKELTDVGFDHIPPGKDRILNISRAQTSRRLGKIPPPYPNGWFAVVESTDLKIGSVKAVAALGQNLCVYRGEDGVARCVDAYCPHLGAHFGIGGAVSGNCIECPFHKWKFGTDGNCVSVPELDSPPKGVSIKTWHTVEADHAIWIWHDAEGRPPLWKLADAPELKTYGYRGRNEYTVSCHIQEIPENGADVAHLNAVHSTSTLTNLGEKFPFLLDIIGQHYWTAAWSRNDDHTATVKLTHDYKIMKVETMHMDVEATQNGPAHVRLRVQSPLGPVLISQSVTPIGPLLQKVTHRLFSPAYNAPIGALGVKGEAYMFERDVAIWNNKCFISSPAYVRTDKTIRAFRAWFSQFYSEHSRSFKDACENNLDW